MFSYMLLTVHISHLLPTHGLPPRQGLPLRILRPSIVGGASLHHIMPGYIGNAGGEALENQL